MRHEKLLYNIHYRSFSVYLKFVIHMVYLYFESPPISHHSVLHSTSLSLFLSLSSLALVLPDYSHHYIKATIGDTITQAKCKLQQDARFLASIRLRGYFRVISCESTPAPTPHAHTFIPHIPLTLPCRVGQCDSSVVVSFPWFQIDKATAC